MPKKKKKLKVPKRLQGKTTMIVPIVVKDEPDLFGLSKELKRRGVSYSDEILMKYITSYYFRRNLEDYLDVLGIEVSAEYYIELYTFP